MQPLLQVSGLTVGFVRNDSTQAVAYAVEDVSFELSRGEILCLVGESGCGKSVTAHSLLRLLPSPPVRLAAGKILFDGQDLAAIDETALQRIRGNRIGMVFQEPVMSLNPVLTIGDQLAEGLRLHRHCSAAEAKQQVIAMLDKVGIVNAAQRLSDYPHQLSGGMCQRVMIAMALICRPELLIADEPTTALDVTTQGQIFALIRALVRESDSALLLITHDLGVVEHMADRVVVMYAGRIVEQGPVRQILANPRHPYTQGLLASRPHGAARDANGKRLPLEAIPGTVPNIWERGAGCLFAPRCRYALEVCSRELPPAVAAASVPGWSYSCWCHERLL